jgi:hypothetical protein
MLSKPRENKHLGFQALALASFTVFSLFFWQGHKGFSLWDEGFLWYGVQRVMLGEVPIRDFMAYDPGRYYWSAALLGLWGGNGIMALRGVVALFQAMGLFIGLLLIARSVTTPSFSYLLLSAITLAVWMYPRHKLFDISLCILLMGVLVLLVQHPTSRRYFLTGLCVGLVAVFGRNHGVYGVAGSLGIMAWLVIERVDAPRPAKGFVLWAIGVAVGFTPLLLMLLLVPGFAAAFWESILFFFEIKSTNLTLPVPWPWRVAFGSVTVDEAIRGVLIGLFFIAMVVFGVVAIAWGIWQRIHRRTVSPALIAAAALALPYAHYSYSRADIGHLALGIFPFLIGCLVWLGARPPSVKWSLALMLCGTSVWMMHVFHPGWQCYASKQCVGVEISGSHLDVDPGTASDVGLLRKLADEYAPNGGRFMAAPFWPGAYPLLERKSPMWEIYAIFPRNGGFEQLEIERIKAAAPGFILIFDYPLDGREALRFRNSHPLIHQYIQDNFELLSNSPNPAYQIYKPVSAAL